MTLRVLYVVQQNKGHSAYVPTVAPQEHQFSWPFIYNIQTHREPTVFDGLH